MPKITVISQYPQYSLKGRKGLFSVFIQLSKDTPPELVLSRVGKETATEVSESGKVYRIMKNLKQDEFFIMDGVKYYVLSAYNGQELMLSFTDGREICMPSDGNAIVEVIEPFAIGPMNV